MTLQTTKHSFTDMLAAQQASKHNSDLQNLAAAVTNIDAEIAALQSLRTEVMSTAIAIEAGQVVDVSVIKRLYDSARPSRVTL